jgi:hypothetical protein
MKIDTFLCPSDGNTARWEENVATKTNYRGVLADMLVRCNNGQRGSSARSWLRAGAYQPDGSASGRNYAGPIGLSAISDGTSNTLLISEGVIFDGTAAGAKTAGVDFRAVVVNATYYYNQLPTNCLSLKGTGRKTALSVTSHVPDVALGERAYDTATTYYTGVFTLLPPNSPSCGNSGAGSYGGASASSEHTAGVNGVRADGSVRFITDSIETKNLRVAGGNPQGAGWGPNPPGYGDEFLPPRPYAGTGFANGDDNLTAGAPMSWGLWADFGAINSGASISL